MKTFTKEIVKERLVAPTTDYWESVIRKCNRVKSAFMWGGFGLIAVKATMLAASADLLLIGPIVTVPESVESIINIVVLIGWAIAGIGFAAGWTGGFIAKLTVKDPNELQHS